ncbi:M28 family peptidase [Planctomycetota bacterium]|nr:M28 family peptidase [Planctomycetota bacterium]
MKNHAARRCLTHLSKPHKFALFFAALLLTALTACTTTETTSPQTLKQPTITKPQTSDAQTYNQLIDTLAADDMQGRGVGYEGLIKARNFIITNFKASNLQPGFKLTSEDETNHQLDYQQPFSIRMPLQVDKKMLAFTFEEDGVQKTEFFSKKNFELLGITANSNFTNKRIILAGYGINAPEHNYNSYEGIDPQLIKDSVVVVYRYEPVEDLKSKWAKDLAIKLPWTKHAHLVSKVKLAEQHGAAAVIVVNPPSFALTSLMPATSSYDKNNIATIPAYHARTSFLNRLYELIGKKPHETKLAQNAANKGTFKPIIIENVTISGNAAVRKPSGDVQNVAGIVPGSGALKNQIVFVGAHYDHIGYGEIASRSGIHAIHNGADDNASGTALVIMLAQQYKQYVDANPTQDRRTVFFTLFSAEERGLLGSRFMVNHFDQLNLSAGSHYAAMLNYDMVGRIRDNKIDIFEVKTSNDWLSIIEKANQQIDFAINTPDRAPGGSDHMMFISKNIPAIHFFSGLHPDYHKHTDTSDKINSVGAAKLCKLSMNILKNLTEREQTLSFASSHQMRRNRNVQREIETYQANLTAIRRHPVKDSDKKQRGYMLRSETQGLFKDLQLQQGDKLLAWNDKKVLSLTMLRNFIRSAKSDDHNTLRIMRGDEILGVKFYITQKSAKTKQKTKDADIE